LRYKGQRSRSLGTKM